MIVICYSFPCAHQTYSYFPCACPRDMAKIVGVSSSGNKSDLLERLRPVMQAINQNANVVVSVGCGALPWVFTDDEIDLVDARCRALVFPHGCHAICSVKEGIFQNPSSCWRMVSKLHFFLLIPVLFHGTNQDLHLTLSKLVHGVILLLGKVITERVRRRHGYQTCFHHICRDNIGLAQTLIPEGLSELEKQTPPNAMKTHIHQVVHYPSSVDRFASLSGGWMFGDERRNKVNDSTLYSIN